MTTDIQTTRPIRIQDNVNIEMDIVDIVNTRLPLDLLPCLMSFLEPECRYNDYCNNYSWEELEYVLNNTLQWGPDFCNHLFKIFKRMNDNRFMFYPNARNDTDVECVPNHYSDLEVTGVDFSRLTWFHADYVKMPGGGKKWFLDDYGTNYEAIAQMMVTVLKRFDDWYWGNYSGTTLDSDLLNTVLRVYSTLDKYADMSDDDFDNDDNSVEEASPYYPDEGRW